jgi:hypothetical protein
MIFGNVCVGRTKRASCRVHTGQPGKLSSAASRSEGHVHTNVITGHLISRESASSLLKNPTIIFVFHILCAVNLYAFPLLSILPLESASSIEYCSDHLVISYSNSNLNSTVYPCWKSAESLGIALSSLSSSRPCDHPFLL